MKNYILPLLLFIYMPFYAQQEKEIAKEATSYYSLGNYALAIPLYKEMENWVMLAKSYDGLGDYAQAKLYYEKAMEKSTKNVQLSYDYARFLYKTKDYKAAEDIFYQLQLVRPKNANFAYYQGLIREKQDSNKAQKYFLKTYGIDSTHLRAIYKIGRNYLMAQKFDKARKYIDKGLELDANYKSLLRISALTAFYSEEYEKAVEVYQKLFKLGDEFSAAHSKLAQSYLRLKDYKLALEQYQFLYENYPQDSPTVWSDEMAYTYKKLGDIEKSKLYYKKAIAYLTSPLLTEYLELAKMYREQKNYSEELKVYKKMLSIDAKDEEALLGFAVAADNYYADRELVLSYYENYLKYYGDIGFKKDFAHDRASYLRKKIHLKKE